MHTFSQPRTLILTERRPHIARLSPDDVAFLLEHHRGRLEVLPTGRRDRYRLTALGCVGVLLTPTCRFVIQPKVPLANVFTMLDPLAEVPSDRDRIAPEKGTEALDFLAGQLARRMSECVADGLPRAYRECHDQGTVLHGRLDLPAQLREAPGRKDQLRSQYDDFTPDVPGNQVVKATAELLLAASLLGAEVRPVLRQALAGYAAVSSVPLSEDLWEAVGRERLPTEFRSLLDLCRLLADCLTLTHTAGTLSAPSFLLDLERVFERHITRGIVEVFAGSRSQAVAVQTMRPVTEPIADRAELTVRPDVTIDRDGRTLLVIDAKWKRFSGNAETTDLYQVLTYGTLLGAEVAALVYPGRRWSVRENRFLHIPLQLAMYTVPVGGSREACLRSVRRLARAMKRSMD